MKDNNFEPVKECNFDIKFGSNANLSLCVKEVRYRSTSNKESLEIWFNSYEQIDIFDYLKDLKARSVKEKIIVKTTTPEGAPLHTITDNLFELKTYDNYLSYEMSDQLDIFAVFET